MPEVANDDSMNFGKKPEKPDWVEDMGSFNSLPKPIRKSNFQEFLHVYKHAIPHEEIRQVMGEDNKNILKGQYSYTPVKILWFRNVAFALTMPQNWHTDKSNGRCDIVYDDPIRFFRIGCEHEYRELSQKECKEQNIYHAGRCWHVNKCEKCSHIEAYDSSD